MKPSEAVPFNLRYQGPDVDDGSMSVEDIVPVLEGIASAYGRIAADTSTGVQHRLRITGVRHGSADILLEIWDVVGKASDHLQDIDVLGRTAIGIVTTIFGVIKIKKHLKNRPFSNKVSGDNAITIQNSENVNIEMPVHIYNIYKNKLIDNDLGKLVKPLREGHIESAELLVTDRNNKVLSERIDISDRAYFEGEELPATSTRKAWLIGKLNSLTKSTESGYINLIDGARVFYAYVGNNPQALHSMFGTYDGPVRVWAVAYLDESLKPIRLEISEIERAQGELFPPNE